VVIILSLADILIVRYTVLVHWHFPALYGIALVNS